MASIPNPPLQQPYSSPQYGGNPLYPNIGPMIAQGQGNVAAGMPSMGQMQSIMAQAQKAGLDPSRHGYAGIDPYPKTPSEWLRAHTTALDALKEVFEFLAAQDNMDLFTGKPMQKHIYETIILAGVRSITENSKT